jgi:[acyl-carrier-protein] S-malonyltransferase
MTTRALVFPGQGSQAVGMGKALAEAFRSARDVFHEVDEALGQSLSCLMWEGPEGDLTLTENAQPAIMAASLAVVRVLEKDGGFTFGKHCQYVAGHSLGEYSALAAAGALPLSVTAKLLKTRGQAMQRAVPVGTGGMAALLGAELDQAKEVAAEAAQGDVCAVANDNAPGQVVISGAKAAIDRAVEIAKAKGIKRAMALNVSAPFHCALMEPAARAMEDALGVAAITQPRVPVISNVSVKPEGDPDRIRRLLVEQVTGLVRWRETVLSLPGLQVEAMAECGAGKVLTTMAKRTTDQVKLVNVDTPADIDAFLKSL